LLTVTKKLEITVDLRLVGRIQIDNVKAGKRECLAQPKQYQIQKKLLI
jgi:hypothetical protein